MIPWHTDILSKTLQNPVLTSVEGHEIAMLTVKTLMQCMHSQSDFELFEKKVELKRREFDVEATILLSKHTVPKRY